MLQPPSKPPGAAKIIVPLKLRRGAEHNGATLMGGREDRRGSIGSAEVRGGDLTPVGPGTDMCALVLRECIMATIGTSSAGPESSYMATVWAAIGHKTAEGCVGGLLVPLVEHNTAQRRVLDGTKFAGSVPGRAGGGKDIPGASQEISIGPADA